MYRPTIKLIVVYKIPYLIYMDCVIGKLELYQFDIANKVFVKNKEFIDLIPECVHRVHAVDNLLILHNIDAQFTKIFDLSVKPITEPMWKNLPVNNIFSDDDYICDGIKAQHEIDYYNDKEETLESFITGRKNFMFYDSPQIYINFDFNSLQFDNCEDSDEDIVVLIKVNFQYEEDKESKLEGDKSQIYQADDENDDSESCSSSNIYSDDIIYASDNIIFDLKYGAWLGYMLSLKNYSSMSKSQLRVFRSLLLRSKNKIHWLRFIKYLLLRKTSIEVMTKVFLKIHEIYKDASQERLMKNSDGSTINALEMIKSTSKSIGGPANQIMKSVNIALNNSERNIIAAKVGSEKLNDVLIEQSDDNSRLYSGEIIIFQHEMIQIFEELTDLPNFSYSYCKALIIEYIRCLQEYNLPSQPRLQSILWKYVWKNWDLVGFQNLLQYKVFDDNLELAKHLIELGNEWNANFTSKESYSQAIDLNPIYLPTFDFGINMMFRLKQYKDVFDILLKVRKYSKALEFARKSGINLQTEYLRLREFIDSDKKLSLREKSLLIKRVQNLLM